MTDWRPYRGPWGENRHQWLQADGRWQVCGGLSRCKQCIIEETERRARRRQKRAAERSSAKIRRSDP